jgi:hypothetical protein
MLVIDVCKYGDSHRVKQLTKTVDKYIVFYWVCFYDRLKIAKWIFRAFPSTFRNTNLNFVFASACLNGNFKVARWLFPKSSNIEFTNAFRWACGRGHLNIIKWLVSKGIQPRTALGIKIHSNAESWLHRIYGSVGTPRNMQLVTFWD